MLSECSSFLVREPEVKARHTRQRTASGSLARTRIQDSGRRVHDGIEGNG